MNKFYLVFVLSSVVVSSSVHSSDEKKKPVRITGTVADIYAYMDSQRQPEYKAKGSSVPAVESCKGLYSSGFTGDHNAWYFSKVGASYAHELRVAKSKRSAQNLSNKIV